MYVISLLYRQAFYVNRDQPKFNCGHNTNHYENISIELCDITWELRTVIPQFVIFVVLLTFNLSDKSHIWWEH